MPSSDRKIIHCKSCSSLLIKSRAVHRMCKKCIIEWERNRITKSIHQSQYFVEVKEIIELITDYSMGYSVKCSNRKCRNIININNYHDLHIKFSNYFYSINSKYVTLFNKHHFVKLYGKYRRIMCRECHGNSCNRCNYIYKCCNKEPEFRACWNHPHCYLCNIPQPLYEKSTKFCQFCNKYYCMTHGLKQQGICENCEVSILLEKMKKSLSVSIPKIFGNKVIDIIACYANGFAVKCCNESCKEIICINTRTDHQNMIDANNRKFYHYKINKYYLSPQDCREYYLSFGEYERCFCSDCSTMKLKMCCGGIKNQQYGHGRIRRVYYWDYLYKTDYWYSTISIPIRLGWITNNIWKISWSQCNNMCLKEERYCFNHKLIECIECGVLRDEYYMKYDRYYDEDINGWILYCDICDIYICGNCANVGLYDETRKSNGWLKYKKCRHVFKNEKIGQYSFESNINLHWKAYKYNEQVKDTKLEYSHSLRCGYRRNQGDRHRARKKYKLKSYNKRCKDKKGNKKSKDKFKKKYMMSLQH